LRRPNGFIARHLQRRPHPRQTDLNRGRRTPPAGRKSTRPEADISIGNREVNPPTHWSLSFRQKKTHFIPPLAVTLRKQAQRALRAANDRLANQAGEQERLVEERTETLRKTIGELESFSYSLTHDLRGPLRAMQSFAKILADECGNAVNAVGKDCIRRIITSAQRMDELIADVLNYSRVIQSDTNAEPIDLDRLLRGILESYPGLQAPGVEIVADGPFPPVMGNEAGLTQCISNLLGNAVKFVAPGTFPRVRIWWEARGTRIRLFFQDVGIGIERASHERIFEIFQRLSRSCEGTGIGLAIVKKAIERMGGSVGLDSEPDKGSTFWLELARPPEKTLL
jgi:signal transduction histidine kinase